ncbi:MAG: spore coat associated protein CotJA [Lachnospiraceae bacterium]|nr:spore coat associated protein CotJA [Lachnospiraceae bacterium]
MKNYNVYDMQPLPMPALAMTYVPIQKLTNIYENLEEAFCKGTIFPDLNLPFTGGNP